VRIFRSPDDTEDVVPSHAGADLGRPTAEPVIWKQWMSPTRFLLAGTIILLTVLLLAPTLMRARYPATEMRCLSQLEHVGAAMSMYSQDHDGYPPRANWHWAIRPYISNPRDPRETVEPGSRRDPLKCKMDPSDSPVSYLYLDRRILDATMSRLGDEVTPLAVDEYFHRYATMVWYDGHVEKLTRSEWAYARLRQWRIRRDLDDMDSFSYERIPGTQAAPSIVSPFVEPTEKYIWPQF
jgi:hypothetical protein